MSNDPLIGTTIGSYRVTSRLGQGGMGAVYELLHPGIGKRLALKLLHAEHSQKPEIVQRFFDEARAVNVIGHANIVDIIDFSELPDGRSYILMEFLEGDALSEVIARRGKLEHVEVLDLALQICSALQAAHEAGITHRDLKPENLHLSVGADGRSHVKVLDFGIAKLSDHLRVGGQQRATATGIVMGTPLYMSPEQAAGKTDRIDHRTDVYALGCILYELLSGKVPFDGDTFPALIMQHMNETARPLSQIQPDVPVGWEAVVAKAMAKDPNERFQTMNELAAAMAMIYSAGDVEPPSRRSLVLPISLALIVLATTAVIIYILQGSDGTIAADTPTEADATVVAASVDAVPQAPADAQTTVAARPADAGPVDAAPSADARPVRKRRADAAPPRDEKKEPGRVKITAIPWAFIYVDGKKQEPPPITISLPPGRHTIRAENPELGKKQSKRVTVESNRTTTVRFDLRK